MRAETETPSAKRNLVERWFHEVWERGNLSAVKELLAPELPNGALRGNAVTSVEDIATMVEILQESSLSRRVAFDLFIEQGDWICCCYCMHVQTEGRDQPVKIEGTTLFCIEEGCITAVRSRLDSLSVFEQLGLMPKDTFAGCLSGQRLVWGA